ncbi:tetratricopeptide repeat protein [uncultured Psychrosphaera sp.]|uniref:tetratricopeptide repeat protein n=1 Tax=uncultured Psychrosphaera sp. TaxID=1403522 RepID=UPI00260FF598|nr:tetratricopeptide repeat protein [uncultured Psychrosphaera sp.]
MNTKIYTQVHSLAEELMAAVQKKDQVRFDKSYQELKKICDDNDNTDKDHPVQWETLADFTDDLELAITIYDKALAKAQEINSKDFLSSIAYSTALLKLELGDKEGAIVSLELAKISCNKIVDKELKAEIHDLLMDLQA